MPRPLKAFLDELLFKSGQFALFYIVMRLSEKGPVFLFELDHLLLLLTLVAQSALLARHGHLPHIRFFWHVSRTGCL